MQNENPPLAGDGFGISESIEHAISSPTPNDKQQFSVELMGTVAHIAQFIFDTSPRPVPEIALAAALTLWAGIVGRAWNISGTGLNIYLILVAPTGTGKEAIARGISKLTNALLPKVPTVNDVVGPTEIASAQGLIKWLSRSPSIFSIKAEFGMWLNEINSRGAGANLTSQKRLILDLYNKSGSDETLGAMAYSKREDNTAAIKSPSFTLIGESTPEKLYPNMNESWVSDGFLPRFMVIEYDGPRPQLNEDHFAITPSDILLNEMATAVSQAFSLPARGIVCDVGMSNGAKEEFRQFNSDCDDEINSPTNSTIAKELWTRAHVKALKLAALYAVGCNYISPVVNEQQAEAAIDEIHSQTLALLEKFERGEVGQQEENLVARRNAVIKAILHYCTKPFDGKYGARKDLHAAKIVTQTYLQQRLFDTAPFRKARIGATNALKETVRNMIEADELREVSPKQMQEKYNTTAKAFVVSHPETFLKFD